MKRTRRSGAGLCRRRDTPIRSRGLDELRQEAGHRHDHAKIRHHDRPRAPRHVDGTSGRHGHRPGDVPEVRHERRIRHEAAFGIELEQHGREQDLVHATTGQVDIPLRIKHQALEKGTIRRGNTGRPELVSFRIVFDDEVSVALKPGGATWTFPDASTARSECPVALHGQESAGRVSVKCASKARSRLHRT